MTAFVPDIGWEFVADEVLHYWFMSSTQQCIAHMKWEDYVDDPFL